MNDKERREVREQGFVWDILVQLTQLRQKRGISQAELAKALGTKQQAISRLESSGYSKHNLATLRRVAEQLRAYVDVILVPEEKVDEYIDARYQPVLMDEAPPVVAYVIHEVAEADGLSGLTVSYEDWTSTGASTTVDKSLEVREEHFYAPSRIPADVECLEERAA